MDAAPALLTTHGLRLAVGRDSRQRLLVGGLDLEFQRGQFWCLLGPNGAGKTTLLHSLAGLRLPEAGEVRLQGRPLADWGPRDAACLRGLLPQGGDAVFGLSALQVVLLGRHPHSRARFGLAWEQPEDLAIAQAALARHDVAHLADREVGSLSGGERQRVALAALQAQDPWIWLLDEPLNHLDLRHQLATLAALRELALREQRLVIASIHDLALAARYATHALLLGAPGDAAGSTLAGPVDAVAFAPATEAALGVRLRRAEVAGEAVVVAL
jgi:iron complex transport system ATP-binding protein